MENKRTDIAIIVLVLLYVWLNFSLIWFASFFDEQTRTIMNFFSQNFPESINFLFLFILQNIFVLLFLLISYIIWKNINIKESVSNIYNFFKKQFFFIDTRSLFVYTFGMYFLYILISWAIMAIVTLIWVDIPGFFGTQEVWEVVTDISTETYRDYLILFFVIVILWPFIEELVYRWFVTNALWAKYGSRIGIIVGAFIFAFIHFERQVIWNLFILALLLWYVYYKTNGSLFYCFAFHVFVNLIAFSALMAQQHIDLEEIEEDWQEQLEQLESY